MIPTPVVRRRQVVAAIVLACAAPVSAGAAAPPNRYTISGMTVYDTKTKLTWQQTPPSTDYQWTDAQTYCSGLGTTLGGTGWRLPTVKELQTLLDFSRTGAPYFDTTAFPSTLKQDFWSRTPVASDSTQAWAVFFENGDTGLFTRTNKLSVRCVR